MTTPEELAIQLLTYEEGAVPLREMLSQCDRELIQESFIAALSWLYAAHRMIESLMGFDMTERIRETIESGHYEELKMQNKIDDLFRD